MILLSELKERAETLMRETGKGNRPVYVLDVDGTVYDIVDIITDEENMCFFVKIELNEDMQ